MRVQLPDLSCVALIQAEELKDLDEMRELIAQHHPLLRASPLGLLSLLLQQRSRSWDKWLEAIWRRTLEIESFTGTVPIHWSVNNDPQRLEELANPETRHTQLLSTHADSCYAQAFLTFSVRLADFCTDAITIVDADGTTLSPAARAEIEDRNRLSKSLFLSLTERVTDLLSRQQIQISCVSLCVAAC